MPEAKKATQPKIILDVSKPGATPVDPTAKPVIVSNRPLAQDPMTTSPTIETETPAPRSYSKVKIQPLHDSVTAADDSGPDKEAASESKDEESAAAASESSNSADSAKTEHSKNNSSAQHDQAELEAIRGRKQAEREEELASLAASRRYYLPINQVHRRRTKQLIWLSLAVVVVVGAGWFYLLLDAGLISIPGITVPTHFFR